MGENLHHTRPAGAHFANYIQKNWIQLDWHIYINIKTSQLITHLPRSTLWTLPLLHSACLMNAQVVHNLQYYTHFPRTPPAIHLGNHRLRLWAELQEELLASSGFLIRCSLRFLLRFSPVENISEVVGHILINPWCNFTFKRCCDSLAGIVCECWGRHNFNVHKRKPRLGRL